MNDFREHFDLSKLDEHSIGMIAYVLKSPPYETVFAPYLQTIRESMNKLMLDRTGERKDKYPDDFLAGGITAIDGLLHFFTLLIEETNMERIHKAMATLTDEEQYTKNARAGQHDPVLGANQKEVEPVYSAEEDY